MKDLEKIKSEDLGCQVQDATPGNFGIEQEVAQLVGATVPAPTEPSADDARELGAQLLVFLRRALLPIRSALRTALAAIYAHLDSRCTDYTPAAYDPFMLPAGPYDPMRPFVARTLPNLLQAITAFAPRKISNGGATNDGIPDGMSLAHLLNDGASIPELIDDNEGWTMNRLTLATILSLFPNVGKVTLACQKVIGNLLQGTNSLQELNLSKATYLEGLFNVYMANGVINAPELVELNLNGGNVGQVGPYAKELNFPKVRKIYGYSRFWQSQDDLTAIEKIRLGALEQYIRWNWWEGTLPNLIDWEFGADGGKVAISMNLSVWTATNVLADADKTATFLQNFKEHIALRLTDQGSGKTLTISQAVRDAIHAAEATYGIEAIIVTQKGWTLSPAPGASSQ